VGICFNSIPSSVRFLAGTLDEEKEKVQRQQAKRKPRQKTADDNEEETRPENITGKEKDGNKADKLHAAERTMKKIKEKLVERVKENHALAVEKAQASGDATVQQEAQEFGDEVDGVKFLFNPKSFTQTVENIFHFSFLIKRGEAGIVVRPPSQATTVKRPGLCVTSFPSDDEDNQGESKQAVVAFNMRDWRRICKAHKLKEGDLKHRTGSKQTRTNSSSAESP
jgi:Nse4 C-terminal